MGVALDPLRGSGRAPRRGGASSCAAEAVVYLRAPGTVARCRGSGEALIVLETIRGISWVDLDGLAALDEASP